MKRARLVAHVVAHDGLSAAGARFAPRDREVGDRALRIGILDAPPDRSGGVQDDGDVFGRRGGIGLLQRKPVSGREDHDGLACVQSRDPKLPGGVRRDVARAAALRGDDDVGAGDRLAPGVAHDTRHGGAGLQDDRRHAVLGAFGHIQGGGRFLDQVFFFGRHAIAARFETPDAENTLRVGDGVRLLPPGSGHHHGEAPSALLHARGAHLRARDGTALDVHDDPLRRDAAPQDERNSSYGLAGLQADPRPPRGREPGLRGLDRQGRRGSEPAQRERSIGPGIRLDRREGSTAHHPHPPAPAEVPRDRDAGARDGLAQLVDDGPRDRRLPPQGDRERLSGRHRGDRTGNLAREVTAARRFHRVPPRREAAYAKAALRIGPRPPPEDIGVEPRISAGPGRDPRSRDGLLRRFVHDGPDDRRRLEETQVGDCFDSCGDLHLPPRRELFLPLRLDVGEARRNARQAKLAGVAGPRREDAGRHDRPGHGLAGRVEEDAADRPSPPEHRFQRSLSLGEPGERSKAVRAHVLEAASLGRLRHFPGPVGGRARARQKRRVGSRVAVSPDLDAGAGHGLALLVRDLAREPGRRREVHVFERRGLFRDVRPGEPRFRKARRLDPESHRDARLLEGDAEAAVRVRTGLSEDLGFPTLRLEEEGLFVGQVSRPEDARAGHRLSLRVQQLPADRAGQRREGGEEEEKRRHSRARSDRPSHDPPPPAPIMRNDASGAENVTAAIPGAWSRGRRPFR